MSRPRSAQSPRPLSAIYLGKLDLSHEQSDSLRRSTLLPSPPGTDSNGSGSTGESGTVGRQAMFSPPPPSDDVDSPKENMRRMPSRSSFQDIRNDDDNDDQRSQISRFKRTDDYDEDNTARLSDDRLSTGTGSSGSVISRSTHGSNGSNGAFSRAKSLADRNRVLLDRLSSITSGPRPSGSPPPLQTPARNHRATMREPSALSSRSSERRTLSPSPSLSSFTRSRSEVDLVSGSDTEKERYSFEDNSITPPAHQRPPPPPSDPQGSVRRRMVSAPSPPRTLSRKPSTIRQYSDVRDVRDVQTMSGGSRRGGLAPDDDSLSAPFGTSRYKKSPRRAPLPQEFRDGGTQSSEERDSASNSGSLSPEISKNDRRQPPPTTERSGASQPGYRSPTRRRDPGSPSHHARRSSTVRESSSRGFRSHSRWASETSASGGSSTEVPYRYEHRGGSAENPISTYHSGGRSLVGEGLKAAGLSPRKERVDSSLFTPASRREARNSLPNGVRAGDSIRDAFRSPSYDNFGHHDGSSAGLGDRHPRIRPSSTGAQRFQENIRSTVMASRPSTSAGMYARDDAPRISPVPLREKSQARASPHEVVEERSYTPPSVARLTAPSTHPSANPLSPSASRVRGHPDILLDAFDMLEGHLSRLPSSSASQANDCIRSAQALVDNSRILNSRLRAATSSAIEEHIEAEVSSSESDGQVLAAELWKIVGTEFRESLKASDELVRTLTVFFLSFGKILRDNMTSHRRAGSTGSNEDTSVSARQSLDGERRSTGGRMSSDSGSRIDEWGQYDSRRVLESRNSSDGGRRSLDSRRSLEASRAGRSELGLGVGPFARSSTSLSYVRPSPQLRERQGSPEPIRKAGVFSAFSSRKFFTSGRRSDHSPSVGDSSFSSDQTIDSPTPARLAGTSGSVRNPFIERPALSTLPSESLLPKSPERSRNRRNKTSTTSNATVRGTSILPGGASAPTTQLTTTPIVSDSAHEEPRRTAVSLSRSSGSFVRASMNGGVYGNEREQRKRTLSDTSDNELPTSPTATISAAESRGFRRPRGSLDSSGRMSPREDRKDRRRTIGGLFH